MFPFEFAFIAYRTECQNADGKAKKASDASRSSLSEYTYTGVL